MCTAAFAETRVSPCYRGAPADPDAIRAEAAELGVLFYPNNLTPQSNQWAVMLQDAAALHRGPKWWLDKCGVVLRIMVQHYECCHYPGYEHFAPGIAGLGYPVPVVAADRAYPQYDDGSVGVGGASVILHELGHRMDPLLDGSFGNSGTWYSSQQPWKDAYALMYWPPLYSTDTPDPTEAFAESFALWNMIRKGGFESRINPNVDYAPILSFWDTTALQCGWT